MCCLSVITYTVKLKLVLCNVQFHCAGTTLNYTVLCVTQLQYIYIYIYIYIYSFIIYNYTLHTGYTDKKKAPDFEHLFRVAYQTAHAMSKVHTISMHAVL